MLLTYIIVCSSNCSGNNSSSKSVINKYSFNFLFPFVSDSFSYEVSFILNLTCSKFKYGCLCLLSLLASFFIFSVWENIFLWIFHWNAKDTCFLETLSKCSFKYKWFFHTHLWAKTIIFRGRRYTNWLQLDKVFVELLLELVHLTLLTEKFKPCSGTRTKTKKLPKIWLQFFLKQNKWQII